MRLMVSTPRGSKPSGVCCRLRSERVRSPAPLNVTIASAISAATRRRRVRPASRAAVVPVFPPSLSVSLVSSPAPAIAGTTPKTNPVTSVTSVVKSRTEPSTCTSFNRGRSVGAIATRRRTAARATSTPEHPSDQGKDQALGERLSRESRARCPERGANGELLSARVGAHEEEIGDVHAGDQEDEGHCSKQRQQEGTRVAQQDVTQAACARGQRLRGGVDVGVQRLPAARHRVEFGVDRVEIASRCRTADHRQVVIVARPERVVAKPHGAPECRPARDPRRASASRRRIAERGRHDARDRHRRTIDFDRAPHDVGRSPKSALPHRVAQYGHVRPSDALLVGREEAPERGAHVEEVEESLGDPGARRYVRDRRRSRRGWWIRW